MEVTAKQQTSALNQPNSSIGRNCSGVCKKFKPWSDFDKKSNGLNGHDSRCKVCISKAKKSYKSKIKKHYRDAQTIESKIIGVASQEKVEQLAKIIATSIIDLCDKGLIK